MVALWNLYSTHCLVACLLGWAEMWVHQASKTRNHFEIVQVFHKMPFISYMVCCDIFLAFSWLSSNLSIFRFTCKVLNLSIPTTPARVGIEDKIDVCQGQRSGNVCSFENNPTVMEPRNPPVTWEVKSWWWDPKISCFDLINHVDITTG